MPVPKKVRPPLPAAPLSRWFLRYSFDFPSRSWSLPAFENPRQVAATFNFFSRKFLIGDSSLQRTFSDPAKGGSDYTKPHAGRIGIRPGRLLVKPKQQPKEK
jgi:hypothetical protein